MKYYAILISIVIAVTICQSLLAQSSELQIGLGYQNINYFGTAYSNDSVMIGGSPLSYPDPFFTLSYQRSLKKRLFIQAGLRLMRSFYGYKTGYYFPALDMYIERVNHANMWNVVIPLDLKLYLTKKVFVKAGMPLTVNFKKNGSNDLSYDEWEDKQYLYSIYNQLHNSYQRYILNYGLGGGVDLWKICIEVYLQNSLSAVSQPIQFGRDSYNPYNRITTAYLSLAYRFDVRKN